MRGNPNPEALKYFCLWNLDGLEILIEKFGMESWIQDCPGFPYMGRQGDALTPDATRLEFIDDFIYLGLAAFLEMKMALREILIRLGWERPEGCLSVPECVD